MPAAVDLYDEIVRCKMARCRIPARPIDVDQLVRRLGPLLCQLGGLQRRIFLVRPPSGNCVLSFARVGQ